MFYANMRQIVGLTVLFVVLLSSSLASSKLVSGRTRLDKRRPLQYLSKFGSTIGVAQYRVRFRLPSQRMAKDFSLQFQVFLDENWEEIDSANPCAHAARAMTAYTINFRNSGEWSEWKSGNVHQSVRPHVWYFAASMCDNIPLYALKVDYEIQMFQPNASHYSVELLGTPLIVMFQLILYMSAALYFFRKEIAQLRTAGQLHPMVQALNLVVLLQILGTLLHLLHLWRYSINGRGLPVLDCIAEISGMLTQIVTSSLLLVIALGYTLTTAKIRRIELTVPVILAMCILHTLLVALGKLKDDASYKFHENEGAVGVMISILRLLLCVVFMAACRHTNNKASRPVQSFLKKFVFLGSLYLLAFPLIFFSATVVAPYLRHKYLSLGVFVMQFTSIIGLGTLFLSRGEYFKVSTMSRSFLPAGSSFTPGRDD